MVKTQNERLTEIRQIINTLGNKKTLTSTEYLMIRVLELIYEELQAGEMDTMTK